VRFVPSGRTVRWVPLRPGERSVRIAYTRSDTRLTSWQRPLSRGTVYVRGTGKQGSNWRDWTTVRGERNASVGTRGTPRRSQARPTVQSVDRGSPGSGVRGSDRNTSTQSDHSRNPRETERPARDNPARQERWERVPSSSPRPGRGSGIRAESSNALTRAEKYEYNVRSRVHSSSAVVPSGAGRRSSAGREEGVSISRGGRASASPIPGRATRPQAEPGTGGQVVQSPRARSYSSPATRPRAESGAGGQVVRSPSVRSYSSPATRPRAEPGTGGQVVQSPSVRSYSAGRYPGYTGGTIRGGGGGGFGFGFSGSRGGRSVR